MRIVYLSLVLFCVLPACENAAESNTTISCGAGTALDAAGTSCMPVLGEGLEVTTEGTITPVMPDEAGETTEEAYTRGFDEGAASVAVVTCGVGTERDAEGACVPTADFRTDAVNEGAASVTPLNCVDGTQVNETGDGCVPTEAYRAAAVEEGRLAGVAEGIASVTPLNCLTGTQVNETADGCVPTEAFRAAAFAEGVASVVPLNCLAGTQVNEAADGCIPTEAYRAAAFAEGVASITPLNCAAGTVVNAVGDACVPNLGANAEVAQDGTVQATTAALDAARAEGVASITPLNCAAGTEVNAGGDACVPNLGANAEVAQDGTVQATTAALDDARQAGVNSVDITSDNAAVVAAAMPMCGWATELWDGDAQSCLCADDAAVRDCSGLCGGADDSCEGCDGIQNSGTVLDVCGVCGGDDTSCQGCDGVPNSGLVFDACGLCDGPGLNEAGCCGTQVKTCRGQCVDSIGEDDVCESGLTMDCARRLDAVPCNLTQREDPYLLAEFLRYQNADAAQEHEDCLAVGNDFDECDMLILFGVTEVTCPDNWSFSSMEMMMEDEEGFREMLNACPNQLVDSIVCTPQTQTYACYGKTCGGWAENANSCSEFVCETADGNCAGVGFGDNLSMTCETGTICDAGSVDSGSVTCLDGAACSASTGTGNDNVTMNCQSGSNCNGAAGTGSAKTTMNCLDGATCDCRASTGEAQCIMNCEQNATCSCNASTGNARCVWNLGSE
jgi:hypothetical protein